MMKVASLHSPLVRRTIESINEGRLDDFMALFARDATVVDGPKYRGSAPFGRGRNEKHLACRCILMWYRRRMRREQ
jgi:hypothetical protein